MTKIHPKIGKHCTIAPDVIFGERVILHGFSNLYGCRIGDDCRIGTFVEIQSNTILGKGVRVQSHSFICSNIIIEDNVFIGHNVSFINDRYPTSSKAKAGSWETEGSRVCFGASIGTGAVIMCGIEVGTGAVIGAGSLVTQDIEAHTVVAGVPAKIIRRLKDRERGNGGKPNEK
jgi:UDP-2-acetamido-3-amino-2,3-dideoxy-glucuronate N-acetyltransferase